jgi:hypothetical protein
MASTRQPVFDLVSCEKIATSIQVLRGQKVLLDSDLAELYGVETKVLLQAVRRNSKRFPEDFMFELSEDEWQSLRSQFVTLNTGRGQHRKYRPHAFTEQGVAMLSSVLRSDRAIAVNIQIMRAFVRMRELIDSNRELSSRLDELETRLESRLDATDETVAAILSAIRSLMNPPRSRPIGFTADLGDAA